MKGPDKQAMTDRIKCLSDIGVHHRSCLILQKASHPLIKTSQKLATRRSIGDKAKLVWGKKTVRYKMVKNFFTDN